MNPKTNTQIHVVAISILTLLATACASSGKHSADVLNTRSLERWNLLIAGKADKAYEFLSPGFRATKPRAEYTDEMTHRPVHWKSAKFMEKECQDEDACTVRIYLEFDVKINTVLPVTTSFDIVNEKWVRLDGKWFFLPSKLGSAPVTKGLR